MYVLAFYDGIGPYSPAPEPPTGDNTVSSVAAARTAFSQLARDTFRDVPTDQGGPWADLHHVSTWDGISYGDGMAYRLILGKRLGVNVERG